VHNVPEGKHACPMGQAPAQDGAVPPQRTGPAFPARVFAPKGKRGVLTSKAVTRTMPKNRKKTLKLPFMVVFRRERYINFLYFLSIYSAGQK